MPTQIAAAKLSRVCIGDLHASRTDVEHNARTPVDHGPDGLITNDSYTVTKAQHRGNEST
jgi:hypothetical protein